MGYLWIINHLLSGLLYIPTIVWPFHQPQILAMSRLGWRRLHLRKLLWWVAAWGLRLARCWRPGLGLEVHGFRKWEIMFSCWRCLVFSWNGPPFHISFQMCIKSFWGCLAGCHIHFQRLDKLCRGQCGRCIYWYHFYWVEAVKQFDFPSSRLSHTVGICLTQCCAGMVTAVEILYLNMKPLDHHSPGISIWSSDIFWSCAKFHPVPVPRSYQASDCSAFVTHFSFSVVGAIRTLLAGDGNHLLSPPKRFRWVKTISIPATNHAVCWGTRWLPILSSSWWCSISSIPSCPSWSPVEDSSALQPVLHPTYIVYKMNMNIYV